MSSGMVWAQPAAARNARSAGTRTAWIRLMLNGEPTMGAHQNNQEMALRPTKLLFAPRAVPRRPSSRSTGRSTAPSLRSPARVPLNQAGPPSSPLFVAEASLEQRLVLGHGCQVFILLRVGLVVEEFVKVKVFAGHSPIPPTGSDPCAWHNPFPFLAREFAWARRFETTFFQGLLGSASNGLKLVPWRMPSGLAAHRGPLRTGRCPRIPQAHPSGPRDAADRAR